METKIINENHRLRRNTKNKSKTKNRASLVPRRKAEAVALKLPLI